MTKKELINNYINILINKGIDKDFMIFDNNELACTLGLVNNNFVLVNNQSKNDGNFITFLSQSQDISERSIRAFLNIVASDVIRPTLNTLFQVSDEYNIKIENGYRFFDKENRHRDVFSGDKEYDMMLLIIDAICHRNKVKSIKSVRYDLIDEGDIRAFYTEIQEGIKKFMNYEWYKNNYKIITINNLVKTTVDHKVMAKVVNMEIVKFILNQNMRGIVKKDKIWTLMDLFIDINPSYDLEEEFKLYKQELKGGRT